MHINNIKNWLVFLLCMIVNIGCKKDKPEECQPLPPNNSIGWGWNYVYPNSPIPSFATFNPNNPDEILYVEFSDINAQNLVVYNIKTKVKTVLHTGKFMDNRQWGKSGWIIFDTHQDPAGGYTIYKVRPDGSQKEILVLNNAFCPVIHPDGNKFLYLQGTATFVIKDLDGNTLKSCGLSIGSLYPNSWINDSIVLFGRTNQIWQFNTNTCHYNVVVTSPFGADKFYCMGYLPPDKAIWGHIDNGIYQTSIYTGEEKLIKSSCNSRCYYRMSYSPQIDKMLLYRETYTTPDSSDLYIHTNLVLMKPDGTCEKEIDLGY